MTVDDFLELFEAGEIAINFEDLSNVEDAEAIIELLVSKQFSAWSFDTVDEYIRSRFVANKEYTFLICDTGGKSDMVAIGNDYRNYKYESKNIDWKDLTANILGVHYEDVSESDFDSVLKGMSTMPIDEYIDGDEVFLLDGSDAGDFSGGWNPRMSRLVGKTVVPMSVVRNDRGHITEFMIHDKEEFRDGRAWWHWDPRFVELTRNETMVPVEDFNSILD